MKKLSTFLQEDGSRRYSVMVPDFIADREDFPHYEKDRFLSMEKNLKKGDILFDVGTELGWQSAIYAQFVGAENMCLFEPAAQLWPTIKQVWEVNGLLRPKITCRGLVSDKSTNVCGAPQITSSCYNCYDIQMGAWPSAAEDAPLSGYDNWAAIHSYVVSGKMSEISLDKFSELYKIVPDAITMDVEGAEQRILKGTWNTLLVHRPLVWVSIHPEIRLAKYGTSRLKILNYMIDSGYSFQYLGVDHEQHYFFYPDERYDEVVLVDSPWMTHGKRNVSFEEAIPDWKDPWQVEAATW